MKLPHVTPADLAQLDYLARSALTMGRSCEREEFWTAMTPEMTLALVERVRTAEGAKDKVVAALRAVLALSSDRRAFVLQGPRAFARAENLCRAALAEIGEEP